MNAVHSENAVSLGNSGVENGGHAGADIIWINLRNGNQVGVRSSEHVLNCERVDVIFVAGGEERWRNTIALGEGIESEEKECR